MNLAIIAAVFPAIFIGELPDKTMFASLVMASRGKPLSVWLGAAGAFLLHVVIAVSIGVGLFKILPHRVIDLVVALLFAVRRSAAFIVGTFRRRARRGADRRARRGPGVRDAFVVIFLAEWGDLTQVLTANLAVRYHSALSVGVGAVLGLWAVSAIAVIGGHGLLGRLPTRQLRIAHRRGAVGARVGRARRPACADAAGAASATGQPMSGINANANHSIAYSMWFTGSGGGGWGSDGALPCGAGVIACASIQTGDELVGQRAPDRREVDARDREPAVGELVHGVVRAQRVRGVHHPVHDRGALRRRVGGDTARSPTPAPSPGRRSPPCRWRGGAA